MPGCGIHFLLAERALRARASLGARATAAAYLGAVAPDMGYCPGGEPFLSDLAHYVTAGRLAESLARNARCDVGRAFAFGWATHVLADALVHPLINHGAGALMGGAAAGPRSYADSPEAHVRVEQGLDAVAVARWGRPRVRPRSGTQLVNPIVRLVTTCYAETYGRQFSTAVVRTSYRALIRAIPIIGLYGWFASSYLGEPSSPLRRIVSRAAFLMGRANAGWLGSSPAVGFLAPARPPAWLLGEVFARIENFPRLLGEYTQGSRVTLPDFNLDTGTQTGAADDYGPAVRTREELARHRRPEGCSAAG